MANYNGPTEGGSGGRRGHSNMEHFVYSSEIKESSRKQRRIDDRESLECDEPDHWPPHDILWLRLAREIHKLNSPGLLPWETEDTGVKQTWSLICQQSEIPFLEQRLARASNPQAEMFSREALKIAKKNH